MSVYAVVPVKDLREAKSRLSPVLDPEVRADLARRMLRRVLFALRGAGVQNVCVVSPDETVLDLAARSGVAPLVQEDSGLNLALEHGRLWAMESRATELLVLPADLPLLEPDDVRALLEGTKVHPPVSISPDGERSGTNALLLRPPDALPFHFGLDSFTKHVRAAEERDLGLRIVERPGLAFDLDTVEDFARLGASR